MRLPIIKRIATDYDLVEEDLYAAVRVLDTIASARGVTEEELDVIGDQNRHYGVPMKDALNTFMKRVTTIGQ